MIYTRIPTYKDRTGKTSRAVLESDQRPYDGPTSWDSFEGKYRMVIPVTAHKKGRYPKVRIWASLPQKKTIYQTGPIDQYGVPIDVVVPYTGVTQLEAVGAAGGAKLGTAGKGARVVSNFNLIEGDILTLIIAKKGQGGGGGGATWILKQIEDVSDTRYQFVWLDKSYEVLICAAGGNGATSNVAPSASATYYTPSFYISPTNSPASPSTPTAGSGGGSLSQIIQYNAAGEYKTEADKGGYGCGGAFSGNYGGSGGGWTAGAGQTTSSTNFTSGTATVATGGQNSGQGRVTITSFVEGWFRPTVFVNDEGDVTIESDYAIDGAVYITY